MVYSSGVWRVGPRTQAELKRARNHRHFIHMVFGRTKKSKAKSPALFDGRVPPPDFVSIETTRYCNLSCRMCIQFQDGTTVTGPHMNLDLFENFAKEIFPFVTRFQPSISGEPLMSKGFDKMLDLAKDFGVKTEICTNATLLNPRMRSLVLESLGKALISFDAADKQTFEDIRSDADFDSVVESVRALCSEAKEIPLNRRPLIGLGCVLMEKNIRGLSALVDLAKDMGVDFLGTAHVHPVTPEMKAQSLVHFRELAIDCIENALKRAREIGLTMMVQPLDQLIAYTATSEAKRRAFSIKDGVVEGLSYRSVNMKSMRPFPEFDSSHPFYKEIHSKREKAWIGKSFVRKHEKPPKLPGHEPIWVCDFLWNKTYVALDGNIRPCCVPGIPNMGNLRIQSFEEIWNGDAYVRMRRDLARRHPVPYCRGCQHIREVTDPTEVSKWLQGRQIPKEDDTLPLPEVLSPVRERKQDEAEAPESVFPDSEPPILQWEEAKEAARYVVEFSVDGFLTIDFSTDWHGEVVNKNSYRLPDWAWAQAPRGKEVFWRVAALFDGKRLEVGWGSFRT